MVTICAWEVGGTDFEQFLKLLTDRVGYICSDIRSRSEA